MTEYKDKLPPRYKSWLDVLNMFKEEIEKHDALSISFLDESGDKYSTTLDYIKARCFEEFTISVVELKKHITDYTPGPIVLLEIGAILEGKSYFIKPKQDEDNLEI